MQSFISSFDMLKIGVGPSSSHTLGPWKAVLLWLDSVEKQGILHQIKTLKVDLYGSLSLTGKGHATDIAILMGLQRFDPVTFPCDDIDTVVEHIAATSTLHLGQKRTIPFNPDTDIIFHDTSLPFHPNGMTIRVFLETGEIVAYSYYSIGGGFVVEDRENPQTQANNAVERPNERRTPMYPYPILSAEDILHHCSQNALTVSEVVWRNEIELRNADQVDQHIQAVWLTMLNSMYEGCHTQGILPGGLNVVRRASLTHKRLISSGNYQTPQAWLATIRATTITFRQILKWVSCFALAVNEVNASLGRVVTAPTNGSAGVVPAVLMYYLAIENHDAGFDEIKKFLLVASVIGSLFKQNATISAAMGGCQAEIGVSSAMAAGALTELMGGDPSQVLIASEIAMEHHLGLTCDPIRGLVQIPCIERNAMGAIKAINACEMALELTADQTRVSLDEVIQTMWQTAQDMQDKYKETSRGGLAIHVNVSDC